MNIYIKVLAILYFLHSQKLCTSVKHNRLSCDEVNKELIAMGVIIENIPEGTLDLSFQNVFRFHTCLFFIFLSYFSIAHWNKYQQLRNLLQLKQRSCKSCKYCAQMLEILFCTFRSIHSRFEYLQSTLQQPRLLFTSCRERITKTLSSRGECRLSILHCIL